MAGLALRQTGDGIARQYRYAITYSSENDPQRAAFIEKLKHRNRVETHDRIVEHIAEQAAKQAAKTSTSRTNRRPATARANAGSGALGTTPSGERPTPARHWAVLDTELL